MREWLHRGHVLPTFKMAAGGKTSKAQQISDSGESSDCSEYLARNVGVGAKANRSLMATRPNASAGYWLCCLLPLAFGTHYLRRHHSTVCESSTYAMLTIASAGMCVESLCFFAYLFWNTGLHLKLIISFVPGLLTMLLYALLLERTWRFAIFWGFAVTFCYQNAYIRVLKGLPHCFSFGEAAVLVQGLMLFVLNAILQLPNLLLAQYAAPAAGHTQTFSQLNALMINALFCLFIACCLLAKCKALRQPYGFYPLLVLLLAAVTCTPVTRPLPVVVLYDFLFAGDTQKLSILIFYFVLVGVTVATVWWQLRHTARASTRTRKIFHLLIVLVYVPGLAYQCAFLYIASGVALAIFAVLELFRILDMPPLGNALKLAFASFADEKDTGLLALTPFCLLIGCSLPIWIAPCPCSNHEANRLALLSGVLAIGCGDTAASVVGSKYGRIKWSLTTRTLEGTAAFIVTVVAVVGFLHYVAIVTVSGDMWFKTMVATLVTALVEARTDQIDNLVLPLVFYILINVV